MRSKVDKILETLLWFIMSMMVVNVLWQVFSRFVLDSPSSFTDELARYLMIWIGVLGAAYVSGKNMHVAIDLIPSRSSKESQRRIKLLVHIIIILFAIAVLIVGGCRLVYISYILEQKSPALQIPLAAVYFALPLSGFLIVYYKINDLILK